MSSIQRKYLDQYLYEIICDELDQNSLDYLYSGLEKIKNKDQEFISNILVNQALAECYREYLSMIYSKKPIRLLLEEEFRTVFLEGYFQKYNKLDYENIKSYDWKNLFENLPKLF